jgi:hypothetical protein
MLSAVTDIIQYVVGISGRSLPSLFNTRQNRLDRRYM